MNDGSSGASDPSKQPTKISHDDLYTLSGGYNNTLNNRPTIYSTRLSPTETVAHIKRVYTKPENRDQIDQQGLMNFIQPSHEKIASVKFDNKRFKSVAPEIENAALILVSSILSPNDLQDSGLQFSLENEHISDTIKEDILNEITNYFNNDFDIGNKLSEWIKECLFGCGSQPVLVLPDFKFDELKSSAYGTTASLENYVVSIIDQSVYTNVAGMENLVPNKIDQLLFYAGENITSVKQLSAEDKKRFDKEITEPIKIDLLNLLSDEMSQLFPRVKDKTDAKKIDQLRDTFVSELTAAIEDTTINITTKMKDGDVFRITENPKILRFHNQFSMNKKYDLANRLHNFMDEDNRVYKAEPVVAITSETKGDGKRSKTFPTVMVLPPESVKPVCIPGNNKEHVGYFIVLDQFGHPLVAEENPLDQSSCGDGYGSAAFDAFFSSRNIRSLSSLTNGSKGLIVSKIFEHILDKYLKSKVADIGLGDMDVSQLSSITQVMLRRLLYHKQTIMIFVPEPYITYYAFDYRPDGTGKSKLEDAAFILHLRTTYLVTKILAMQKNAIARQTVSFDLTDKTADPEQVVEQMRNTFVSSASTSFTANPSEIIRTAADRSVRFMPTNGYPGIENFKVESDTDSSGRVEGGDDNLLDTLNTLWIDFLDVPHDALNKLGENEYARSIVANHLFFAKKILKYHGQLETLDDKFVRSVIRYAKPLRSSIAKLLNKDGSNSDITPTTTGTDASKIDIDDIIDSICTSLPTPKIAPDKAQFAEIKEYMDNIDELVNRLISSEMVPGDDQDIKNSVDVLKAMFKSKLTKQFTEIVGIDTIFDIPTLDDTLPVQSELLSIYSIAKNLSQMFKSAATALDVNKDTEEEFANTDSGGGDMGGFGDDMGMDDSMDMGGDMSMGDMGSDMSSMDDTDTSMTTSSDTSTSTDSSSNNDDEQFNFDFDNQG